MKPRRGLPEALAAVEEQEVKDRTELKVESMVPFVCRHDHSRAKKLFWSPKKRRISLQRL